jgi:uracil-DNA glycosylase
MATAADFVPDKLGLPALRRAAEECQGCELWRYATRTVFGAGSEKARLMLVGEQPGDREDLEGEPFVGPAGKLLDKAIEEAGIADKDVYLTNAVKHFKWKPQGKRRLHQTPHAGEVKACRPWLEAEIEAVKPSGILALGATAARSIFGASVRVTRDRGKLLESPLASVAAVTVHPSAILRIQDKGERRDAFAGLIEDLETVSEAIAAPEK